MEDKIIKIPYSEAITVGKVVTEEQIRQGVKDHPAFSPLFPSISSLQKNITERQDQVFDEYAQSLGEAKRQLDLKTEAPSPKSTKRAEQILDRATEVQQDTTPKTDRDMFAGMGHNLEKWQNYLARFNDLSDQEENLQSSVTMLRGALKVMVNSKSIPVQTENSLRQALQNQEAELVEFRRRELPDELIATTQTYLHLEKVPAAYTKEDKLVSKYADEVAQWKKVVQKEKQKIQRQKEWENTPDWVKQELQRTKDKLAKEQQKNKLLEEQLREANQKLADEQEKNQLLQQQLEEANQKAADERELRRQAEEKQIELQDKLDRLKSQNREDTNLLKERVNRPLTPDEIERLMRHGFLIQEQLTPEEKRVLANANIREMTTPERFEVGFNDVVNFVGGVTENALRFVDRHIEGLAAIGALASAAALRHFLISQNFDVSAIDIITRVAAAPLSFGRLYWSFIVERVQQVRDLEQRFPRATRYAKAVANAAVFANNGWVLESLVDTGASPTSHQDVDTGQKTLPANQSSPTNQFTSAPPYNPNTAPMPNAWDWPDKLTIHSGSIWSTVHSEIASKLPSTLHLNAAGQEYLTDAIKDVVSGEFRNPGLVHSGDVISLPPDIKHKIGEHILKALDANIKNGSFAARPGLAPNEQNIRAIADYLRVAQH